MAFLKYMLAHGSHPGPTQRLYAAGGLAGILAGAIAAISFAVTHTWSIILEQVSFGAAWAYLLYAIAVTVAGVLYAYIFQRTANDKNGGWLFGLGFSFLIWMLGPALLYKVLFHIDLSATAAGIPALLGHLFYGFLLGVLFPFLHPLLYRKSIYIDREQPATSPPKYRESFPQKISKTGEHPTEKRD